MKLHIARFTIVLSVLSILAFQSVPSWAQDAAKKNAEASIDGFTRPAKKEVPIKQTPTDALVSERIRKILTVTEWVNGLKVETVEGVVRLQGTVAKRTQKDWIEDLVHDVDGVTAVTNEIDVKTDGWFDLNPAKTETESLIQKGVQSLPYLFTAVVIFAIFFGLAIFVSRVARRAVARRMKNPLLVETISRLMALPVVLLGLYLVLRTSGLTGVAVTLVSGTGALGLIIGFALKNIIENYFSGVMLSVRNPYTVGDTVEIDGRKGVVKALTTRGTVLVDFDGNLIMIPNSTIYNGMIINNSANPASRVSFTLNIAYEEDVDRVRGIVLKAIQGTKDVLDKPEPMVLVQEFTATGINIGIYFWISSKSSGLRMKAKVMECVKVNLQKNDVAFPGERVLDVAVQGNVRKFSSADHKSTESSEDLPDISESETHSENDELLDNANRGRKIDHGDKLI